MLCRHVKGVCEVAECAVADLISLPSLKRETFVRLWLLVPPRAETS